MPTSSGPATEVVRAARLYQPPRLELPWLRNAEAPPMESVDELQDPSGMDAFPASDPPYCAPA